MYSIFKPECTEYKFLTAFYEKTLEKIQNFLFTVNSSKLYCILQLQL